MPPEPRLLNDRVPGALSDAVMRFIARKPENRPPTAEAMRRELAALAKETGPEWVTPLHTLFAKPLLTPASDTGAPAATPFARRGILLGAMGVVLAVAALVGTFASNEPAQARTEIGTSEHSARKDAGIGSLLHVVGPQEDAGMPLGTVVASPVPVTSPRGSRCPLKLPSRRKAPP